MSALGSAIGDESTISARFLGYIAIYSERPVQEPTV